MKPRSAAPEPEPEAPAGVVAGEDYNRYVGMWWTRYTTEMLGDVAALMALESFDDGEEPLHEEQPEYAGQRYPADHRDDE